MWEKLRRINIRTACFLAAFAAVGAGFMFREDARDREEEKKAQAYELMTVSESAENIEKMTLSLRELEEAPQISKNGLLSDIRLFAELALSALGHMELSGAGANELFSFLSAAAELSQNAVYMENQENTSNEALFSVLRYYAEKISDEALPHLRHDRAEFESSLEDIFSDTTLETVLFENGYGDLASKAEFATIGGGMIEPHEAIDIARTHLGKKAYVEAEFSEGEIPVYHVGGKNISAVISAKSGIIMQFLFDLPEGDEKINENEAKNISEAFLKTVIAGSEEKILNSSDHAPGMFVFEYVPLQNDVLCLNERILIGVSHGSGRICLFDATEYYRYHNKKLIFPEEMLSSKEIIEKYGLTEAPVLCKIERKPGIESLCYKISKNKNEHFISAVSGIKIN